MELLANIPLSEILWLAAGLLFAGAATGGLRLCPHVYNTREHVERAVRGVRALLPRS